LSVLGEIHCY